MENFLTNITLGFNRRNSMGIPFLSEIEKLINEHGSAKILQERIALAKDQYEVLEKELAASKSREADLTAEIKRLSLDNEKLNKKINNLNSEKLLALKYGVYWDKDGNAYCPKCKAPGMQIRWASYVKRQIHALKCSCTDVPFVLMENGEPIHAQEAMKRMAKQ
jgi:septal ring factor EnvC (AmiA/AmiB activator)